MKVFLDSIGCRLNQSEIEKYAGQFKAAGHQIVDSAAEADLVVVNTCTVTQAAASDSRQKIRHSARSGQAGIVVTGCWSTLEETAALALPGVSQVIPNAEKDALVPTVLGMDSAEFDLEPLVREPLPGAHLRTRAFIKTQDGCDNFCTFCITRVARGHGRSQPIQQILGDIRAALQGGAREVVLSGVHLGSWGQDFSSSMRLRHLIQAILDETSVERLRLSSLEPWDLDEAFFRLWENPRMCRHLHLPVQSGSRATLKRMVRNTTPESFMRLVEMARSAASDIAITTDLIVGFPGETEGEFQETLDFVEKIQFSAGHVFPYSMRAGTAAAKMKGQVPGPIARKRGAQLRGVIAESSRHFRRKFLQGEFEVLWEATDAYGPQGWRLHGLTDHYIRVEALSRERLWNQISRVRLVDITDQGMLGEIL